MIIDYVGRIVWRGRGWWDAYLLERKGPDYVGILRLEAETLLGGQA